MAPRYWFLVGLVTLSIGVSLVQKSKSTSIELIVAAVPDGTRFPRAFPASPPPDDQNPQYPDICDLCRRKLMFFMNFKGPQEARRLRTSLGSRAAPIEAELAVSAFSKIRAHAIWSAGSAFARKPLNVSKFLCKLQSLVAAAVSSVTPEETQSRVFIITDENHVSSAVLQRLRKRQGTELGVIQAIKTLFPCATFINELRALNLDDPMSNSSATTHTRSQKAIARNNQTCACDARQRLLVLATGRSGSTTTTNMLNQVPGMYISGETKLFHLLFAAMRSMSTLTFRNPPFLCAVRDLLDVSVGEFDEAEYPIFGVKEVTFNTIEKLEFIRSVYPCAKFVINTRANLTAQAQSGQYRGRYDAVLNNDAILKSFEHENKFNLELGTNFQPTDFTKLLRWVGVQGCFYKGLMHSNDGGLSAGNMSRTLSGKCSMDLKSRWPIN